MKALAALALLVGCDFAAPEQAAAPANACVITLYSLASLTGLPDTALCHAHGGLTCVYDAAARTPHVTDGGFYAVASCDRCTGPTLRELGDHCEPPPMRDMSTLHIEPQL